MWAQFLAGVGWALGQASGSRDAGQAVLAALVLYLSALILVRLGDKRFLGRNSTFDTLLAIILGSTISRGINGAAVWPTLAGTLVLVGLHYVLARLAYQHPRFASLIKGAPRTLMARGEICEGTMRGSNMGRDDLLSAARLVLRQTDLEGVDTAVLEHSGAISMIPGARAPRVIEVRVAEGVQVVRIQLEG